ncbi:hypothetical protein L227DRAFT_572605 [Lentinus tigrinus ALCF2SS1-6]|uniref:DNA polymerase lambda n=1 Tax=Lentinus tigrinus ALCF2SS1-6 TaxID=1328759 RepID=A0A5C2SJZ4_9APHY|nr:hypothetical protein L227DRAFT_572605 [Lentinus tigrinus ALCF2SS1-6]
MNRTPESIDDYLARRQRSRTSASYSFNPDTIPIDTSSVDSISLLQGYGAAHPAPPPQPDAKGSSIPRSPLATTAKRPEPSRPEEDPLKRKRKADDAGPPLDRRKHKKSKSIDEQPTPTAASAAMAPPPEALVGTSEASTGVESRQQKGRLAELSQPAALSAIEHVTRARGGASTGSAGKSELQTSPASSADVHIDGQKRPGGVKESNHAGGSHRDAPADCSNITTPPSTAPEPVAPVSKVPAGKAKARARAQAREPAKPVTLGRSVPAAPPKGKGRGKKEKPPRYTPSEYAKVIQAQFAELRRGGKNKPLQFLRGKRIFFYGGDFNMAGEATRNRMRIIVKHGGELLPEYDPEKVTHIICEREMGPGLLHALKLKKPTDIPEHIPTVTWSWIVSGQDRKPVRKTEKGEQTDGDARVAADASEDEDNYEYPMDWLFNHATFKERIDAGTTPWGDIVRSKREREAQKKNGAAKDGPSRSGASTNNNLPGQSSDDISHISDFTQDKVSPGDGAKISPNAGLPSPPSSPTSPRPDPPQPLGHDVSTLAPATGTADGSSAEPSTTKFVVGSENDPLAEFYEQARAERYAKWLGLVESDDESDSEEDGGHARADRKKGKGKGSRFVCDDKHARQRRGPCPNLDVIAKLQELQEIHAAKPGNDNHWRGVVLAKAIGALRTYPTRIKSEEEAVAIFGIGPKTAQKIMEVIKTGNLRRIECEKTEDFLVCKMLEKIYGVGRNIARMWYNSGVRTLEDVASRKGGIELSIAQEIGFKYFDDINSRIPRAEVQEIYNLIEAEALRLDPKLFIRVMGSFRRGKADCGDIDVLITRPTNDGKTHRGILRRLLSELHKRGIVTDDLCLPKDFEDLELVYRGLCRRDAQSRRRRIDFLTVPWTSRGAALLYYTGDDIFNRSMRLKARKMGYSLNQRGLFVGVVRDPSDWGRKLCAGKLIASESEEEIFRILGVPWQEPHERIRN